MFQRVLIGPIPRRLDTKGLRMIRRRYADGLIEVELKKGARCARKREVVDQMWWSARDGVEQGGGYTKDGQYHREDGRGKADDAIEYSTE